MTVPRAYQRVWQLRWRFLTTHAALTLFAAAILSPLLGAMVRLAIGFSGAPALADQDIARFLLSPTGLACAIVVASVLIVAAVLETAVLMWIHMADRHDARANVLGGLAPIIRRLPALLMFAALLVGRLLLISAPFLLLAALAAWYFLAGHDINFFLAARPPEFTHAVIVIGALAVVMGALLVTRLVSWSMALPGLVFSGFGPADAFRRSADLTRKRRLPIATELAAWAAIGLTIGALVAGTAGTAARFVLQDSGAGFGAVATLMAVALVLWFLANMAATTLTAGSLAVLLADRLGLCGAPVTVPFAGDDAETGRSAGTVWTAALALAAVAVGALVVGGAVLADARTEDDVTVIAHRGAAGARPENTLASVRKAIEDGADWVEIDVQETRDGEVVVIHDSDFMKIAGVDLKIWNATMEDLAGIDIGGWFAPEYAGERTPTLAAVLREAKGRANVLIELKYYGHDERLEERVADIVDRADMAADIAVMSLNYDGVRKMKVLRPGWRVGLLAATAIGDMTRLEADFLAVSTGLASVHFVRRARAADRDVYVWTVNDPMAMSRMIARGAAGLITDEPGLARDVLAEHAELGTAARLLLVGADLLGIDLTPRSYRDQSP
jgi:glycerophosphoryl diester phosphodiesterase